jgi:hypothetical protein
MRLFFVTAAAAPFVGAFIDGAHSTNAGCEGERFFVSTAKANV